MFNKIKTEESIIGSVDSNYFKFYLLIASFSI